MNRLSSSLRASSLRASSLRASSLRAPLLATVAATSTVLLAACGTHAGTVNATDAPAARPSLATADVALAACRAGTGELPLPEADITITNPTGHDATYYVKVEFTPTHRSGAASAHTTASAGASAQASPAATTVWGANIEDEVPAGQARTFPVMALDPMTGGVACTVTTVERTVR